jgi:dTDP-4-amino-4,6-dideoxygalactose transaminase
MPADMDAINALAKKHNLIVVEDACQAHGAEYKGRRTGALGHAAGFSLNRSKNLCGAEGGLFTTDNDEYYEYAKMMREFGEVVLPGVRREYNAYTLGWMYRPTEFANAFTRSQFTRLEQYNGERRELAEYLNTALAALPGVKPVTSPSDRKQVYWTYVVEFRPDQLGIDCDKAAFRKAAEAALVAEGVPIGQWQQMPVPAQDVFQTRQGYGRGCPWTCRFSKPVEYYAEAYPQTLDFLKGHTCLQGVYPPNDKRLMEQYVAAFEKVLAHVDTLIG